MNRRARNKEFPKQSVQLGEPGTSCRSRRKPASALCNFYAPTQSPLLKHLFPQWDAVVFDPVVDAGNARADPELFLRNHPEPLILDKIQYCPELVPCIKRIVDLDKHPSMYLLTGSQ